MPITLGLASALVLTVTRGHLELREIAEAQTTCRTVFTITTVGLEEELGIDISEEEPIHYVLIPAPQDE